MNDIGTISNQLASRTTQEDTQTTVLRKALDIQKQNAQTLIDSLPAAPKAVDPTATLGRHIDIKV
jgi:hypothetical protein